MKNGIYFFPKKFFTRHQTARDSKTPIPILGALASDVHEEVRLGVAGNPITPKTIWVLLMDDPADSVRAEVAARSDLQPSDIAKLSMDSSEIVWNQLAQRDDLNEEVLKILCLKTLPVRIRLASKSNELPDWVSITLAKDSEYRVRSLVAGSTKCETAWNILKNDPESYVRNIIENREYDKEASEIRKKNQGRRIFAY